MTFKNFKWLVPYKSTCNHKPSGEVEKIAFFFTFFKLFHFYPKVKENKIVFFCKKKNAQKKLQFLFSQEGVSFSNFSF